MKGFAARVDSESGSRKISMNMAQAKLSFNTRHCLSALETQSFHYSSRVPRRKEAEEYLMYRQIINNETARRNVKCTAEASCGSRARRKNVKSKVEGSSLEPFKSMAALESNFSSSSSPPSARLGSSSPFALPRNFCDFKSTGFYY